jgi:hypothetical protein
VPDTRALLIRIATIGMLLAGCGSGTAAITAVPGIGADAANPQLPATSLRQPVPEGAPGFARALAARWATARWRDPRAGDPIAFRVVIYSALVFNPGSSDGFTAFLTTRQTVVVSPASAASITVTSAGPPRFATPADRVQWEKADRPSLGQVPAADQRQAIPAGEYSFLPQGSYLTYQQAAALPGVPGRLITVILAHLRPYAGRNPPASLTFRQIASLIATAPLTKAARSAAWQAIASLPGLRVCQARPSPLQPRQVQLCLASAGQETLLSVDLGTASILSISERLLRPSPLYPHAAGGTIIGSTTFDTTP